MPRSIVKAVRAASSRSGRSAGVAAAQVVARSWPATPSMEKSTMNTAAPTSTLAAPTRPRTPARPAVMVPDNATIPPAQASTPTTVPMWMPA